MGHTAIADTPPKEEQKQLSIQAALDQYSHGAISRQKMLETFLTNSVWVIGESPLSKMPEDVEYVAAPRETFAIPSFPSKIGRIIPIFTEKQLAPKFTGQVEKVLRFNGKTLLSVIGSELPIVLDAQSPHAVILKSGELAGLLRAK